MSEVVTTPRGKVRAKTERPRLYKVILINDDFTPRAFVVTVLKKVFRVSEEQAYRVMITAHRRGACVVAVFAKDIAESKAAEATDLGRSAGHPLSFSTEPEE
jgi:ATP-dependent Clp protease adaptor protein ClpS